MTAKLRIEKIEVKYPNLERLGIPVYHSSVGYVLCADIDAKLSPMQRALFNELFGIQTCPVIEGKGPAVYPWDADAVLERMFSGKLTGSQLIWD